MKHGESNVKSDITGLRAMAILFHRRIDDDDSDNNYDDNDNNYTECDDENKKSVTLLHVILCC